MSSDPRHDDTAAPGALDAPGAGPHAVAQMDPDVVRAGSRYSARARNQGLAWGLWAGSALLGMIPLHVFYLGRIRQGILRTALLIGPFALVFVVYIATFALAMNADLEGQDPVRLMMPIFIAWALLILAGLAAFVWWLVDAATMNQRLEAADEKVRREIAAEHGVDPWSF